MQSTLEATGERMIPEHHKGKNIYGAHIARYEASMPIIDDKVVLDIACGSGYGTKLMAPKAKKIFGVDIDKETIEYAEEHYSAKNITYLVGDGIRIPLEDNSVEVVVSYETIEHIEDYEEFMKEVKRVLQPDGVLLLSTPNEVEYMEGNHFHFHEFEYEELKKLTKRYFKYHDDYFQTLWYYSSILPRDLQGTEWDQPTRTISTVPLKPERCVYFYFICSDEKIQKEIKPIGVIGEHYRQRFLQEESEKRKLLFQKFEKRQAELKEEVSELLKIRESYTNVIGSKSYRIGKKITYPFRVAKKAWGVLRTDK